MFGKYNIREANLIHEKIWSEIGDLKLEIEKLKTQILSLRGLVNRKLASENPEPTETIKSPDGLDGLR